MRISAVVPAYNAETYIEATLKSLLNQTFLLEEVIVVDDGSRDGTCRVVESFQAFDSRVRLLKQPNLGVSAARNAGVEAAAGDWILFMDADDIAEAALIERGVQRLDEMKSGNWGLIYCAYEQVDEKEERLATMRSGQVEPEEAFGYALVRNEISVSGTMVSKRAFWTAGGFAIGRQHSEDWDLWLRMAQRGGFVYVDEPLVKVRRHAGNASRRMADMHQAEKEILSQYPLEIIREGIFQRNLPQEHNLADYVSLLFRLELWEEGHEVLQQHIQMYPTADLFFLNGLYAVKTRNEILAIHAFEEVIREKPGHGAALNNLAALYAAEGRFEESEACLAKAIQLYPGYMDASHNLKQISGRRTIRMEQMKITWRKLREQLLAYAE